MQRLNRNRASPGPSAPPAGSKRPAADGAPESPAKRPRTDAGPGEASLFALSPSRLNADAPTVEGPAAPGPGQRGFKESRIERDLRKALPLEHGGEKWTIPNPPWISGGNRIDKNPGPRKVANSLVEANKPIRNPDGTGPQTNDELRRAGAENLFRKKTGGMQNRSWPSLLLSAIDGNGNVVESAASYINGNPRINNPDNLTLGHHKVSGEKEDRARLRDFMQNGDLNGSGRLITEPELGLLTGNSRDTVSAWVSTSKMTKPPSHVMDYERHVRENPTTSNSTPSPIAAGPRSPLTPSQEGYPRTPVGYFKVPYPQRPDARADSRANSRDDTGGFSPYAGSLPGSPAEDPVGGSSVSSDSAPISGGRPPLSERPRNSPATDSDLYGATPLGYQAAHVPASPGGPASPAAAGNGPWSPTLLDDPGQFDMNHMPTGAFNTPVGTPKSPTPGPADLTSASSSPGTSQPSQTPASQNVIPPGQFVGEDRSLLALYAPRPRGEETAT